jgi:hypothetical protein
MRYKSLLVNLLVLVSLLANPAPAALAQGTTFNDPFSYCAAVGTIDAPDSRYVGPKVPESIARGLQAALQLSASAPLEFLINGSSWRCMDGKVYACTVGANLPCEEKADTSRTPSTPLTQYCQQNPDADIPAVVTGRATVYEWKCQNGAPTIVRQVFQPDARGFLSNIWYEIEPGSSRSAQLPAAGGPGAVTDSGFWFALGALFVLAGITLRRRALAP